ncbi:Pls/PosA family non-ribosomal peptide synthetase [Pseudonocardia acaciae]|uniref:Pls/PosA family non-ribosomal peptide synthetase n=1 Tax=Pseudonocardia acaciae TaxID=551276 RepID=UPI0007E8D484|nr:Pls/PosA family non-ribosomal peptide synthetase [Pseudonocardia acaciae]
MYFGGPPAPARTLAELFADTVRAHPDAPALDDGHEVLSYRECARRAEALRDRLWRAGVGAGHRVGVRIPSGRAELYLAILAVLAAGAAYVPVDADDPDERAEVVWREAAVAGVLGPGARFEPRSQARSVPPPAARGPAPTDDAWVIFTSGSTGTPKGVAITHRSAAAFVDAEAELFLTRRPLRPGDRVLAGLSVAFDASCEEMWLAWRHGACLVPAPRALVRAGTELGPWLVDRQITVVSTVPTLAALWPVEALERVRLLILGGEACPPELSRRLAAPHREVWNTYGPTEATVVACAAPLDGSEPVRIGLPLRGWQLAVLDPSGRPVPAGAVGELVIGGVGVGRYLDPAKDRQKFVPVPALGWTRAYRSGDLVRADPEGLVFRGRADDQVKLGGRRIELGEIDTALLTLPGVAAAAAAVRTTAAGGELLVGYLVADQGNALDLAKARATLAGSLPAALVPHLVTVDELPVRTSGKVDRAALPWPPPRAAELSAAEPGDGANSGATGGATGGATEAGGTAGWLAGIWHGLLAAPVELDSDFFELGGTSLATARLVATLRERYPEASVQDVFQHPRLVDLAARLDELDGDRAGRRPVHPTPRRTGLAQLLVLLALYALTGARWLVVLAGLGNAWALLGGGAAFTPPVPWWWVAAGWALLISPPGRLLLTVLGVRLARRGLRPGTYTRGGWVHLRLWTAERLAAALGIGSLAGTALAPWYARLLGCRVGANVDLRTTPPVTGLAALGDGCAVEPEVDLAGWWLDGDMLHVGAVEVGAGARIGGRATLMPGASVGAAAEVDPGTCVYDRVPAGERWGGVPARRLGDAGEDWPRPKPERSRGWSLWYAVTLALIAALPLAAALPSVALLLASGAYQRDLGQTILLVGLSGPLAALSYALLVAVLVRLAGLALRTGTHHVDSLAGWAAWLVDRLVTSSRVVLFPLYASLATPWWFRLLGARVGRHAEISTTTGLPGMMKVGDGGFLADDTLIAPYEVRGGWLRVGESEVGRRAFAGNSSIVGPDLAVPDGSLIAVLSSAPERAAPDSSWVGRPPFELPRTADAGDPARTFAPPARLVLARAGVESLRLLPWAVSAMMAALVVRALVRVQALFGWALAVLAAGPVLVAAGAVALALTTAVKWLLVGRFRVGEHPLWSSFVWRNELFDVFYEQLAMPWLGRSLIGTPLLNAWLRTLGARIGAGVWCDSHWLPETDLVHLDAGATVNRGCVLQTHLFHDRLMRIAEVHLGVGATLGPHAIVLPGATIGAGTAIGGGSLVMRGERVPAQSRWLGNPISAWPADLAPYPESPRGRGRHLAVPARGRPHIGPIPAIAAAVATLAAAGLAATSLLTDANADTAPPPAPDPFAIGLRPASTPTLAPKPPAHPRTSTAARPTHTRRGR